MLSFDQIALLWIDVCGVGIFGAMTEPPTRRFGLPEQ
jgi:hypothetical protein